MNRSLSNRPRFSYCGRLRDQRVDRRTSPAVQPVDVAVGRAARRLGETAVRQPEPTAESVPHRFERRPSSACAAGDRDGGRRRARRCSGDDTRVARLLAAGGGFSVEGVWGGGGGPRGRAPAAPAPGAPRRGGRVWWRGGG